jgi:predicted RNA binding protein YcfA (HicA-like mRNA interferase family)
MTKLTLISSKQMEKLIFLLGFEKVRQKGSHAFYRHQDGRPTTLSHHPGRIIARPLLREILREIEIDIDQYNDLLGKL